MVWQDLFRAIALVMVIEGLLPFVGPARARQALLQVARLDDRALRTIGLVSVVGGLLMLQMA